MILSPISNTGDKPQAKPSIVQKFGYTEFAMTKIKGKYPYGTFSNGKPRPHVGIDFRAKEGTPIFAPMDGAAVFVDSKTGYGKHIIIRNKEKNLEIILGHLSWVDEEYIKKKGGRVSEGDIIAKSGSTGFSTGPHLHIETKELIPFDGDIFGWVVKNKDNEYKGTVDMLPFIIYHKSI